MAKAKPNRTTRSTSSAGGQKSNTNQHVRTRRDHATELAEDYVEAIDDLLQAQEICRVTDLATRFAVSHVTVNRTVARLQRDGWVTTQPYGPVELTEAGRMLARASRQRHEIVLKFLIKLGIREQTANVDAEGIEHHVSEETLRAMQRFVERAR
ncbi:MAG: manganese-binding transcriptional regulator MntR [Planctomycetota bacterium]|nr:manganese-binding transcriptional regulator MntR [Planctomycetota bacterium]MDA1213894.1 manganese-binding transcriptional regulator MntR [Planctomycetota bacterium]